VDFSLMLCYRVLNNMSSSSFLIMFLSEAVTVNYHDSGYKMRISH
jgi:hypothetical protein